MGWSASPQSWKDHGACPLASVSKHAKDMKSIGMRQHVSPGRCFLGSLKAFSSRRTRSVGQGRAGSPPAWAKWEHQHHLPPHSQAGAKEIGLGWAGWTDSWVEWELAGLTGLLMLGPVGFTALSHPGWM